MVTLDSGQNDDELTAAESDRRRVSVETKSETTLRK